MTAPTDLATLSARLSAVMAQMTRDHAAAAAATQQRAKQQMTARSSSSNNVERAASSSAAAAAAAAALSTLPTKQQQVQQYIAKNRNAGTSRTYASGWSRFEEYLKKEGIAEKDVSEWDVADYLRVRVEEHGVAAATMGGDRSAIADHFKHTAQKGVTEAGIVKEMMAVLRTQAPPSKPKMHMSAELMRELIQSHDAQGPSGRASAWIKERDIYMMLLMMMAFLREGEAVALTWDDVEVKVVQVGGSSKKVLHIFIARSKTDQARAGHVVLLGANDADPTFCPVSRYARYLAVVKAAGVESERFFPTVSGSAMSSSTPCPIVQQAVRNANALSMKAGYGEERWGDPLDYGSHSMRRGGVTTARANGVSMLDIQKHGRWKSLTVFSYVGTTPAEQLAVTNGFLATTKAVEAAAGEGAAAAAAGAARPRDVVPSQEAHALRAAAASSQPLKAKAAAAASSSSKEKARGRKRAAEEESEEEGEEEEEKEEEGGGSLEEDAIFEAALGQGWREAEEEEAKRARGSRRPPSRAAKAVVASTVKSTPAAKKARKSS
jgi:site-specific recombinase XerD